MAKSERFTIISAENPETPAVWQRNITYRELKPLEASEIMSLLSPLIAIVQKREKPEGMPFLYGERGRTSYSFQSVGPGYSLFITEGYQDIGTDWAFLFTRHGMGILGIAHDLRTPKAIAKLTVPTNPERVMPELVLPKLRDACIALLGN